MNQKEIYIVTKALVAAHEARENGVEYFYFEDGEEWDKRKFWVADQLGIVDGPYDNKLAASESARGENERIGIQAN